MQCIYYTLLAFLLQGWCTFQHTLSYFYVPASGPGWCSRQSRDKWQMVSCNRRTPSSFPVGTHRLHHAWCSLSRCTATWRQSMAKGKTSVNKCGRESSHFEIDRTVRRQGGDPPLQLSGSLPPAVWTCNSWHSPLATLWNFINTQATRVLSDGSSD